MQILDWLTGSSMHIPPWEAFVRLLAAVIVGAIVGIDRELRNKPAGLRTQLPGERAVDSAPVRQRGGKRSLRTGVAVDRGEEPAGFVEGERAIPQPCRTARPTHFPLVPTCQIGGCGRWIGLGTTCRSLQR